MEEEQAYKIKEKLYKRPASKEAGFFVAWGGDSSEANPTYPPLEGREMEENVAKIEKEIVFFIPGRCPTDRNATWGLSVRRETLTAVVGGSAKHN